MAELHLNVPDAISQFADAQVAAGRFPTVQDYVGALVSADQQMQQTVEQLSENPQLAALLEEGLQSGAGRRWSPTVLRELKQQVMDRHSGNSP